MSKATRATTTAAAPAVNPDLPPALGGDPIPEPAPVAPITVAADAAVRFYRVAPGGFFLVQDVTQRKLAALAAKLTEAEAALDVITRDSGLAESDPEAHTAKLAEATAAVTTAAARLSKGQAESRPWKFAPLAANGEDSAPVTRYALTGAEFNAWSAAADADAANAILAAIPAGEGGRAHEQDSAITPNAEQVAAILSMYGTEDRFLAAVESGTLAYVTTAAKRAAATRSATAKLAPRERTRANVSALFAAKS